MKVKVKESRGHGRSERATLAPRHTEADGDEIGDKEMQEKEGGQWEESARKRREKGGERGNFPSPDQRQQQEAGDGRERERSAPVDLPSRVEVVEALEHLAQHCRDRRLVEHAVFRRRLRQALLQDVQQRAYAQSRVHKVESSTR